MSYTTKVIIVFVPFLGDFLSINVVKMDGISPFSFRPLSWGLSFNHYGFGDTLFCVVFVPFLGDFLSIIYRVYGQRRT